MSKLDSLLSRTLKKRGITLDGVNSSYLYFGMWRALFAWHTEDMDLYSVNYLHYGAPKFWYAIAPEDRERFEILAQGMVPEMWRACPEFLRHKELLISPTLLEQNGIPFTRMMQRPGEFVVTYPGSYHSGFNTGYNCAESCNFATKAWVEIGEEAGVCECVPDAVSLDMSIFDDDATICRRVDHEKRRATNNDDSDDSDSDDETPLARKIETCAKREKTVKTEATTGKRARATSQLGVGVGEGGEDASRGRSRARARGMVARGRDARSRWSRARWSRSSQIRRRRSRHVLHVARRRHAQVQVRGEQIPLGATRNRRARSGFLFRDQTRRCTSRAARRAGNALARVLGREEKENAGRAKVAKKPAKDARGSATVRVRAEDETREGHGRARRHGKTPEPERDIAGNGRVSARDAARGVALGKIDGAQASVSRRACQRAARGRRSIQRVEERGPSRRCGGEGASKGGERREIHPRFESRVAGGAGAGRRVRRAPRTRLGHSRHSQGETTQGAVTPSRNGRGGTRRNGT